MWNNRIIKHEKNGNTWYSVHEVFYNEDGSILLRCIHVMKKHKGIPLNDESFDEVMASDFPRVYIHDVKDNPDETCSMEISTNKAFDELFKKEKNRKRVSKKGVQEFFIELLEKGLAKEDGYDLKKASELYK